MNQELSKDSLSSSDARWSLRWNGMAAAGMVALPILLFKIPFLGLAKFHHLGRLLMVAPFVLLPLAMGLMSRADRAGRHSRWFQFALFWHPFALAGLVGSLSVSGPLSPALASLWFVQTLLFAGFGLSRFCRHGLTALEEVGLSMSLIYLPVGGAWLIAHCMGWTLGFSPIIVLLTVLHFHYAGFAASFVTGMTGRVIPWQAPARRWYRMGGTLVVLCPILVALGISFSPLLEVFTAILLAAGMLIVAGVMVKAAVRRLPSVVAKLGLLVAASSLVVTMALAVTFALSEVVGGHWISIAKMAQFHGLLNVLGYATCGVLAFALVRPETRLGRSGAPFSQLRGEGQVGASFFEREGLIEERVPPVTGLVADLDAFARPDFDPAAVDPEVRRFYEQTESFGLTARARWSPGWKFAGKVWRRLSSRAGQLNLPLHQVGDEDMDSRLHGLDSARDGREDVRAWVRVYKESGAPVYVAAYALHRADEIPYMNIAFPLPQSNLTSVLRMDKVEGAPGSLSLTSLPLEEAGGDEGVYLSTRFGELRLPLNETIQVFPWKERPKSFSLKVEEQEELVVATHEMWLFGLHYLTIEYVLVPVA